MQARGNGLKNKLKQLAKQIIISSLHERPHPVMTQLAPVKSLLSSAGSVASWTFPPTIIGVSKVRIAMSLEYEAPPVLYCSCCYYENKCQLIEI
jgi:hypothetical protein